MQHMIYSSMRNCRFECIYVRHKEGRQKVSAQHDRGQNYIVLLLSIYTN